jgi:hypothetical protein
MYNGVREKVMCMMDVLDVTLGVGTMVLTKMEAI